MEVHWKSKIRGVHTKLIARNEKGTSDFVELWESISQKNIPLWYLQILGPPDKEGWIVKKGGIGGALTKRWFVLSGPLLFYFSNDQSDARAKGVVPLLGAEIVLHDVPEKDAVKYDRKAQKGGLKVALCWAVKTRVREFVLSSDNEKERDEWMQACSVRTDMTLEEVQDNNPKCSVSHLRKLLLAPEQMRRELENASRVGTLSPRSASQSSLPALNINNNGNNNNGNGGVSPATTPRARGGTERDDVSGCGVGMGWKYEGDAGLGEGRMQAWDVKTNGEWPFGEEETGLMVCCTYAWTGRKLKALEGTGSRADWDGTTLRWSCMPNGQPQQLYEYTWDQQASRFSPSGMSQGTSIPTWELQDSSLKNVSGTTVDFPNLTMDGTIPGPVALFIAMHKYQWKREGELSSK